MPRVAVEEVVRSNIQLVWNLIKDKESYSSYMDPVRSVEIIESNDEFMIAEWDVLLKGSVLKWREKDIHIEDKYRIEFEQIEGDLESFEGYWQLAQISENEVLATLIIDFEIGIPMLRDMLDPVAERALRENAMTMLRSLNKFENAD
jgi:ribosome-associated toxin RatA of RatAB toxin-antitoxin module